MRDYLKYRMAQESVTNADLMKLIGVSEKTIRNKLTGRTDFTWNEVKSIKNKYFPNDEYEILFAN